jgi:TonB family protein
METLGPPPAEDDDLHLLYEWGDPFAPGRRRAAGIGSILVHGGIIALLIVLPANFLAPPEPPPPEKRVIVTPLVEPVTELTQKEPNKGKVNREIDMASLQPRQRIEAPHGPPPAPPAAAPAPRHQAATATPPAPKPAPMALPEPPKVEATARDAPQLDLPAAPLPAPTIEQPKLALENVPGARPQVPTAERKLEIPGTTVADAIRDSRQSLRSGPGQGANLSPSAGAQGSALELKSDPQGVDFRPYLNQIMVTIRRNWDAVYPQSARMGQRGRVGLVFVISKTGRVDKVTWAYQSGTDSLDRAAVAAISASSPFPPLPAEFRGERVVLQLNFAYNMPRQ